jgi:hypothetical protein
MSNERKAMDEALKGQVVPYLRAMGFKGSMPHFRRVVLGGLDVLTFQFDRYGGGFVIEVARCAQEGFVTAWGKEIPADKVTAWDLPSSWRHRIQPQVGGSTDSWFRFENGKVFEAAAAVHTQLPNVAAWFQAEAQKVASNDRPKAAPSGVR